MKRRWAIYSMVMTAVAVGLLALLIFELLVSNKMSNWILGAFVGAYFLGVCVGFLLCSLMVIADENRERSRTES